YIEGAEISEEFRAGMKLMAIPRAFPPHADLREPLANHEEIAEVASARDDFRELAGKRHSELNVRTRWDRLRKRQLHHGAVFGIFVIGMDELHFAGQVAHACDRDAMKSNGAVLFGLPFVAGMVALALGHPGGLRLKGIQVEMEGKGLLRLAGEIVVSEGFGCGDGVMRRVELGLDLVSDNAG